MKNFFFLFFLFLLFFNCAPSPSKTAADLIAKTETENTTEINQDVCLSKEEKALYDQIMAYRKRKRLVAIPLSASLSKVAQLHAKDLQDNRPVRGRCNLHSWSKAYGGCCYTSNHKNAECMWDKPRELTDYTGNGYEIAHWHSAGATAESSLQGWKKSSGHNAVMINQSIWKKVDWQAIGIGIYKEYSVVWFGKEQDAAGRPGSCE